MQTPCGVGKEIILPQASLAHPPGLVTAAICSYATLPKNLLHDIENGRTLTEKEVLKNMEMALGK
jgi:hypothetical protein